MDATARNNSRSFSTSNQQKPNQMNIDEAIERLEEIRKRRGGRLPVKFKQWDKTEEAFLECEIEGVKVDATGLAVEIY